MNAKSDSSTFLPFLDGTSSSIAFPCQESTATSDSLASILKNWSIFVLSPGLQESQGNDSRDPTLESE